MGRGSELNEKEMGGQVSAFIYLCFLVVGQGTQLLLTPEAAPCCLPWWLYLQMLSQCKTKKITISEQVKNNTLYKKEEISIAHLIV